MITKTELSDLRSKVELMRKDFSFMTVSTDLLDRLLDEHQNLCEAFFTLYDTLGPDLSGTGNSDEDVHQVTEVWDAIKGHR